ncbi:MAG TPA: MBL fold metallo-hydrolase, partial [Candidatus Brocadiia bacterium]|nr:MBL fold metallo-hydrolase [Candidatus Brocadiia bacterium]
MGVSFRTLLSGSSGNAALLDDGETQLLLDCGARSQRLCRAMLDAWAPAPSAAVVSHLHSDHINYASLRTLRDRGTPVYVHESLRQELAERHFRGACFRNLRVMTYGDRAFRVGAFEVRALRLRHAPGYMTHGFAVAHQNGGAPKRLVALTDL